MKRLTFLTSLVAALAFAAPARADVPSVIPFSGRLVQNGTAVTGNQTVTFRLFDAQTAGNKIWEEQQTDLAVTDGLIYAQLGIDQKIPTDAIDGDLYLEIELSSGDGTSYTFSPRLPIASVPYAIHAATADALGGQTPDKFQQRVGGTCPGGAIAAIAADGTVTCHADPTPPSYTGTGPIAVNGTSISLAGCSAGDVYHWNGSAWTCGPDLDTNTTYLGSGPISVAGNTIGLTGSSCNAGDVYHWTGSTWTCSPDVDTNTTYTAGSGLAVAGNSIGLSSTGCQAGYVWKWSGTAWACSADASNTYTATGPISMNGNAIGLSSSTCNAGDVYHWTGSAWTCSPDLDTNTAYTAGSGIAIAANAIQLSSTGCQAGYVWKWSGTAWACSADANTSYTASGPLSIASNNISLSGAGCASGTVLKWNGSTWACAAESQTTYTASSPLAIANNNVSLASAGCNAGDVYHWTATGWACSPDLDTNTTYTASAPLAITGTTVSLGQCPAGQIYKENASGTGWACAADANGGGTITGVNAGTGLTGGGTTGTVNVAVNPAAVQTRVAATCPAGQGISAIAQDGTVTCETKSTRTFFGSYPLPVSPWSGSVSAWTQISTESFDIQDEIGNASTFLKPGQTMQARLCVLQTDQSACQAGNTWLHWRIRHRDNTSIVYYNLDVGSPCPNAQLYYQSCGPWVDQSVLAACTGGFAAGTCSLDFKNDTGAYSVTREAVIQLAGVN